MRPLDPSLSSRLRVQTAPLRGRTEVLLGLPGTIRTRDDYLILLPLDRFGRDCPWFCADVVTCAERVFRLILTWFAPFRAVGGGRS